MEKKDIATIRKEYLLKNIDENEVSKNPIILFQTWFDNALESAVEEPNAMVLATSTIEGKPSARVVLLKGFDENGFSFFTNYRSRKAADLNSNSFAALVFFWPELERQVRIEGRIEKTSDLESDNYFDSRPEGSKISAWVSPQSQIIHGRTFLESMKTVLESQFANKSISRPPNWGGYRLRPTLLEFWQGRANRLHDRMQYTLVKDKWIINRLAP